jgi:uncharacterized membrane protein YfcA
MSDQTSIALWVALTFVAAGLVKGAIGMGLPTVAMGVLSLIMAPAAAAAMLVIPSFVTNVWQLIAGPAFGALLRRLATMMLGVCAGTVLGIGVLTGQSASLAGAALGAVLSAYGAVGLAAPRFTVSPNVERWLSPLIGILTGLVTGATGVFVIPAVPYLNSLGLAKEDLIQALGLSFTVSTVALAVALGLSGQFQLTTAGGSLLAVIPAMVGMLIGQRVCGRLRPDVFRRWFFVGLVVLGVYMMLRVLLPK